MTAIATLTVNPALDKDCAVDQVIPEHKLRCKRPTWHPGGGGINVARAVTKLGGRATALWLSGGPAGEMLGKLLDAEKVEHQPIAIDGMTRENLIVFEESSGQQFRFGMPGPELTPGTFDKCLKGLRELDPRPTYLVLSGSLPPAAGDDFYARLIRQMPKDMKVVLDTSGPALQAGVENGVYLIKPNKRELDHLAGEPLTNDRQVEQAARELIERGKTQVVVVSLGSGGAILVTADQITPIRAPTVEIKSKVGAGDSMVAGLVLALSRGKSMIEAARMGVAAGAAAVMTPGTELCRRDDTERLFKQTD